MTSERSKRRDFLSLSFRTKTHLFSCKYDALLFHYRAILPY